METAQLRDVVATQVLSSLLSNDNIIAAAYWIADAMVAARASFETSPGATASFPLPAHHWLYAPKSEERDDVRDCLADTPFPFLTRDSRAPVAKAAQYAIRSATACGTVPDFDPDAMVQAFVYALCGPAGDARGNPVEVPAADA